MKFFYLFIIFNTFAYSQSFDYEYVGVIKLNKQNDQLISYRLQFSEKNGKIDGVSITDIAGLHETKNKIEGFYNAKTKQISIKESDIIATKSKVDENSFCFISFSSKINLQQEGSQIKTDFKGFFPDGKSCIDGELEMISIKKVEKIASKLTKKVENTKKLTSAEKEKYNPNKMLDSLRTNYLKKDEKLSVFIKNSSVELIIYDDGKIDGDKIDLFINQEPILTNYSLVSEKKIIPITIKNKENIIKVVAKNEGEIAPNTARIEIKDGNSVFSLVTGLNKNEETSLILYRK